MWRSSLLLLLLARLTAAQFDDFFSGFQQQQRGGGGGGGAPDREFYDCLGVEPSCTDAELKKAYRKLALRLHPDKQRDANAAEIASHKFALVQRAYSVLSDRSRRQAYNDVITHCWRVEMGDALEQEE